MGGPKGSLQASEFLKESVLDAGETMTYRRLASALCLHVNHSKRLLQQFVDEQPKSANLKVSMLVCGSDGDGNARTLLCCLEEIENIRDSMRSVFFEHIYAVSPANTALEETALANVHAGFDDFTQTIGVIGSKQCTKLTQEEIGNLKSNSYKTLSQGTVVANPSQIVSKSSSTMKNNDKIITDHVSSNVSSIVNVKAEHESVFKVKDSKNAKVQAKNISNFFSKTNGQNIIKTNTNSNKELIAKTQKTVKESLPKDSQSSICDSEAAKVTNAKALPDKINTHTNKQMEINSKIKDVKKSKKGLDKTPEKKILAKSAKNVNTKNVTADKKRKRVMQLSDSEDSDKDDPFEDAPSTEVNIDSDEDIIPPTPNADIVKITSGIINPRKRRKVVDKTYTTEDGYMVTRKEEVLESCSEDEASIKENIVEKIVKKEITVENKSPAVPKTRKKIALPSKGAQSTIMSFFKKK